MNQDHWSVRGQTPILYSKLTPIRRTTATPHLRLHKGSNLQFFFLKQTTTSYLTVTAIWRSLNNNFNKRSDKILLFKMASNSKPSAFVEDDWVMDSARRHAQDQQSPSQPPRSKAERFAEHKESNRKIWQAAYVVNCQILLIPFMFNN